ncbi:MAG: AAA family ATPase [Caulobacteraceae bacterium]|nr:AAA family ATPase [Caulobacteraceae bacterium]
MATIPISSFVAHQQILIGMAGAALAGSVLYAVRRAPGWLWGHLRDAFSTTVVVEHDQQPYAEVGLWLARHEKARRARRLMLEQGYDYDRERWGWEMTLGRGWHLIRFLGAHVLVHRDIRDQEGLAQLVAGARRGRLTITTLGRRQDVLRALFAEAEETYRGGARLRVFFWNAGAFVYADTRPKRSMDTVHMPPAQKQRIAGRLQAFVAAREDYARKGVPWRIGVLLEGPPGTGKTTTICAIAGLLDRDVYVVNIANLVGDNELFSAFNAAGPDAIVALEDIDTIRVAQDRDKAPDQSAIPVAIGALVGQPAQRVTLSGLLNAIDGIGARQGRILFMTSNCADDIDPALLRPGRVDLREYLGPLEAPEAWTMFKAFTPEAGMDVFQRLIEPRLPITAAALQELLLAPAGTAEDSETARGEPRVKVAPART